MPDDAIAIIQDEATRAAMLALRSETFRLFDRTETQISATISQSQMLQSKIEIYMATSATERLHDAEWRAQQLRTSDQDRQSMARVADKFEAAFSKHCEADEAFQEASFNRFSGWQKWLIGTLMTLLLSSVAAISALVFHGLK